MDGHQPERRPPPEAEITLAEAGMCCTLRRGELSQLDFETSHSFRRLETHSYQTLSLALGYSFGKVAPSHMEAHPSFMSSLQHGSSEIPAGAEQQSEP